MNGALILVAVFCAGTAFAQDTTEPVFRAGTRLVEINVVVRRQRLGRWRSRRGR